MQGASLQSLCLYGWGSFTRQTVLIYLAEVVEIIIIDEDVFAAVIRDLHGVVDLLDKAAGLLDIVGVEENIAEGLVLRQLVADTGEGVDRDAGDGGDLVKPLDGGDDAVVIRPEHIARTAALIGLGLGRGQHGSLRLPRA